MANFLRRVATSATPVIVFASSGRTLKTGLFHVQSRPPNPKSKPRAPPSFNPPVPALNPKSPDFSSTDFTTLRGLLADPALPPGRILEGALTRSGIQPDESLLLELFNHFDSSPKPLFTLFLWAEKQRVCAFSVSVLNSVVNALCKAREFDSAWCLVLDRIDSYERRPNSDTFSIMIRRYSRAGMINPAKRTCEFASNLDFLQIADSKCYLFEILLDSLCKEGHVQLASEYLDQQREKHPVWVPSIQIYNILLNGWFRSRKLKRAERLWLKMKKDDIKPSVVTYGTLVEGYCRMRRVEMAISLIDDMKREGIEPNSIVYNPIIDALGEAGRFKEALGMMERVLILESGPTISTYNSLIKGFCKSGDLGSASKILKMMISKSCMPTSTTYNYFFRYFSKFGMIEEGLNLYSKIIQSGYLVDRLTYHLLVKMLCEKGRLDLAMQIIKEMRDQGIDLDLATSTMLIHLLCNMHRFDEAFQVFEDMIRRGLVPQYLTYQRMSNELKKHGITEAAKKLQDMMGLVSYSRKLPNTYNEYIDYSLARKKSIMKKAEAMSDILKTCENPRELVKRRNTFDNYVSNANRLMDNINRRIDLS